MSLFRPITYHLLSVSITAIIHQLRRTVEIFSDNPSASLPGQTSESAYSSEEQEPRELAGSCCTFKCMISRVKQQLEGSDLHNSAANTPWGYLSFSGARSPIEIHPLCVVYASSSPPTRPAPLPLPKPRPSLSFLPRRRNRHFTYVYSVPLQATTAHPRLCNHTMIKVIPGRLPIRDLSTPSATLL